MGAVRCGRPGQVFHVSWNLFEPVPTPMLLDQSEWRERALAAKRCRSRSRLGRTVCRRQCRGALRGSRWWVWGDQSTGGELERAGQRAMWSWTHLRCRRRALPRPARPLALAWFRHQDLAGTKAASNPGGSCRTGMASVSKASLERFGNWKRRSSQYWMGSTRVLFKRMERQVGRKLVHARGAMSELQAFRFRLHSGGRVSQSRRNLCCRLRRWSRTRGSVLGLPQLLDVSIYVEHPGRLRTVCALFFEPGKAHRCFRLASEAVASASVVHTYSSNTLLSCQ